MRSSFSSPSLVALSLFTAALAPMLSAGTGCGSDSGTSFGGSSGAGGTGLIFGKGGSTGVSGEAGAAGDAGQGSGSKGGSAGKGGSIGKGGAAGEGGSNGQEPGDQPAICALYVSCSTKALPASAAAVIEAYGANGTCWQAGDEVAADCTTACSTGIAQLHQTAPTDCPLCTSDDECSGKTPACSKTKGACVACVSDEGCASGACDVAAGACVECLVDESCTGSKPVCDTKTKKCVAGCTSNDHCKGSLSVCDTKSHACVECLAKADCKDPQAPACNPLSHSCGCTFDWDCPSFSCNEGLCCTPKACPAGACGKQGDDGCGGILDCGACTLGTACEPAAPKCKSPEVCVYSPQDAKHFCVREARGNDCNNMYSCNVDAGVSKNMWACTEEGICASTCIVPEGCPAGYTCEPFTDVTVTPKTPGRCQAP